MLAIRWVIAVVIGGILGAMPVAAQESGTLSFLRTYTKDYTTIEFAGASVTGGSLKGVVTILESSGGPFVAGTSDQVTCVVLSRRSPDTFDLETPCTATSASGDRWYTLSKRDSGDIEEGGPGTLEIVGGTGAYEGVSGACIYAVNYLGDDWVITRVDCTWQDAT